MTKTTLLSVLSATTLLIGAAAARADGVTVRVAGRTDQQVRRDVTAAAYRVCAMASQQGLSDDYGSDADCVDRTVAVTLTKLGQRRR